ncbi:MAG: hypothetical protein ISR69_08635 [Gammaproteobacteria bacterium]|nr:hypothetical protein [Gammaproteobacteria bacterium]
MLYKTTLLLFLLLTLSACQLPYKKQSVVTEATIFPIQVLTYLGEETPLAIRQRVSSAIVNTENLQQFIITTYLLDKNERDGAKWITSTTEGTRIQTGDEQPLYIIFEGQKVFDFEPLKYDRIYFNGVCTDPQNKQQLFFHMGLDGTVNADINDVLFFFYDPVEKIFKHKIIEQRYLAESCNWKSGIANRQQHEKDRKLLKKIHQELRPKAELEITDSIKLPIRQLDRLSLEKIFTQLNPYQFFEVELTEEEKSQQQPTTDSEITEEFDQMLTSEVIIKDHVENANWRIREISYRELWHSWGVLLAENKKTGQWTSFYNIPSGGSEVLLYLSDNFELNGNILTHRFVIDNANGWGDAATFEIDLNTFNITPTHE